MRQALILCGLLLGACHGSSSTAKDPAAAPAPKVDAPPPADAPQPAARADAAEPAPPSPAAAPSFEDALAELDPNAPASIPKAAAALIERMSGGPADEAQLREGIDTLLEFAQQAAQGADAQVGMGTDLFAAACASTGECDAGPVTAEAEAELQALSDQGVYFVYGGEGTVVATFEPEALETMLESVLSAPAKAYFEVLRFSDMHVAGRYDEDGFGGDPADVARTLAKWEALAKMHPAWEQTASDRAAAVIEMYLSLCDSHGFRRPTCIVGKKLRRSYEGFATTNPDSAYTDEVAAFVAEAKRRKWRMDDEQLGDAIEASLNAP